MLRSLKRILGYRIRATDDELGEVEDFFFDDHSWTIRYLVVDTGRWLPGRLVLVSPESLGQPDWDNHTLAVSLTVEQIENSPPIESDRPVSRQKQARLAEYYGWSAYWEGYAGPAVTWLAGEKEAEAQQQPAKADPNLRSVREVLDYRIHATDGQIGHVDDLIAQTDGWAVRYLVVDTRNWLPGRHVLVSPAWVRSVDWGRSEFVVDHTAEEIRNAPEFDESAAVNREYEVRLYDYYGRPKYWR